MATPKANAHRSLSKSIRPHITRYISELSDKLYYLIATSIGLLLLEGLVERFFKLEYTRPILISLGLIALKDECLWDGVKHFPVTCGLICFNSLGFYAIIGLSVHFFKLCLAILVEMVAHLSAGKSSKDHSFPILENVLAAILLLKDLLSWAVDIEERIKRKLLGDWVGISILSVYVMTYGFIVEKQSYTWCSGGILGNHWLPSRLRY